MSDIDVQFLVTSRSDSKFDIRPGTFIKNGRISCSFLVGLRSQVWRTWMIKYLNGDYSPVWLWLFLFFLLFLVWIIREGHRSRAKAARSLHFTIASLVVHANFSIMSLWLNLHHMKKNVAYFRITNWQRHWSNNISVKLSWIPLKLIYTFYHCCSGGACKL